MKLVNQGILCSALALAMVGCADDNPWAVAEGEGGIRLELSASADVTDAIPAVRAEETLTAPDVADFGIRLEKNDGSYSKEWPKLADFQQENSFKMGSYVITAFYGDIADEGFGKPCFIGSAPVTVLEGSTTPVSIEASLANSMVSVTYTDAFKEFFSDYSATVHSEGYSFVDFSKDENRPAFIAPGDVDLSVSITDQSGRETSVQPAAFKAEARHHYHVTLDVNGGNVGNASLVVTFDDTMEAIENIEIDLTDELITSRPPVVTPSGFTSGDRLEVLQNDTPDQPMKFSVMARGGLQEVNLTINSDTYNPPFGKEINLLAASAAQQQQITDAGFRVIGLWNNVGDMALVDISDVIASLPAGVHTISLVAKDKYTRVSEPVSITIDTNAVAIDVTADPTMFGSGTASFAIAYNGRNFDKAFTFKAQDNHGGFVDAPVISYEQRATRAIEQKTYDVTVKLPDTERDEVVVRVFYYGNQVAEVKVPVKTPTFSVAADPFATKAVLKVTPDESDMLAPVVRSLKIFLDGQQVAADRITRDAQKGLIYLSGLAPETRYSLQTSLTATPTADPVSFTTEAATQVPNGDFENLAVKINNVTLNQGGPYTRVLVFGGNMQNRQTLTVSEPQGWSTTNDLTFNMSASSVNSWFVIPSVFNTSLSFRTSIATQGGMGGQTYDDPHVYSQSPKNGNSMVIRNVGYSHNGTVPDVHKKTAVPDGYHSEKAPSSYNVAAGKLFFGTEANGGAFNVRPSKLKGFYKYVQDSQDTDEQGVVEVYVLSGSDVIASGRQGLTAASDYREFSVPLTYDSGVSFGKKATAVKIVISSSNRTQPKVTSRAWHEIQEAYGAVLCVDDLTFEY